MKYSLKTKVIVFVAAVISATSLVSTFLFVTAHNKSLEKEVVAKGIAIDEALARAVAEGLASENLELIKQVHTIAHTNDIDLAQVYSTLWLPVDSYPVGKFDIAPDPAAIKHFEKSEDAFYKKDDQYFDFYCPVFYHQFEKEKDQKYLIGFVRLRLTGEKISGAIGDAIAKNILFSIIVTLFMIIVLNIVIRKYLLKPLLLLHESVSKHKEGEFPESVPIYTSDEIGELSSEFNKMSHALKEREEKLAEEKERLAVTLRSIGDGVIVTDIDGIITLINKVAEQHTGWTAQEAVGKNLAQVFKTINEKTRESCEDIVMKVIRTGLIQGLANHTSLIKKDGTEIVIEDSAAPIRDRNSVTIGVVLVFRDITAKQRMEEELLKIEKLESVGLLAGGIAHDFNNILTAILGNISIARISAGSDESACKRLAEAEKAVRRATNLTQQLLTFSKGGAPVKTAASVVDIIKESAGFSLSGTNVAPEFVISDHVWNIDVDAGQMSQVFNNLIINAVQAMPHGGKIIFTVSNIAVSGNETPLIKEGDYVKISVKDTGNGIPEEHLPRIFDAYFTTKQKGSGLGLASVYSIIQKHGGYITVESSPSKGTTFHIYLPASHDKSSAGTGEEGKIVVGQGKILIMDDEELIRDIAGEMLRSLGYDVDMAKSGTEAIELYKEAFEAGQPFDAVIMDLTIPGDIGGKEVIRKLRDLDPAIKAIVSSGYSSDPVMADYKHYGFSGVITKPYTIEGFSKVLYETIVKG